MAVVGVKNCCTAGVVPPLTHTYWLDHLTHIHTHWSHHLWRFLGDRSRTSKTGSTHCKSLHDWLVPLSNDVGSWPEMIGLLSRSWRPEKWESLLKYIYQDTTGRNILFLTMNLEPECCQSSFLWTAATVFSYASIFQSRLLDDGESCGVRNHMTIPC